MKSLIKLNPQQLQYLKSLDSKKKKRKFLLDCLIENIEVDELNKLNQVEFRFEINPRGKYTESQEPKSFSEQMEELNKIFDKISLRNQEVLNKIRKDKKTDANGFKIRQEYTCDNFDFNKSYHDAIDKLCTEIHSFPITAKPNHSKEEMLRTYLDSILETTENLELINVLKNICVKSQDYKYAVKFRDLEKSLESKQHQPPTEFCVEITDKNREVLQSVWNNFHKTEGYLGNSYLFSNSLFTYCYSSNNIIKKGKKSIIVTTEEFLKYIGREDLIEKDIKKKEYTLEDMYSIYVSCTNLSNRSKDFFDKLVQELNTKKPLN